jgi:hypothetical protein
MIKTITLIAFFASFTLHAQQTVDASGGDATGSGGSSSYSVGQIVYTTHTGSNGSVSQGVQQSFEIFTLSNAALSTVSLTATTYPNPTSDYVVLAISDANLPDLSYALYDIQGRAVTKGQATQSKTQIDMQSLATGTYVLKVNQNNQELKTFKIIKK